MCILLLLGQIPKTKTEVGWSTPTSSTAADDYQKEVRGHLAWYYFDTCNQFDCSDEGVKAFWLMEKKLASYSYAWRRPCSACTCNVSSSLLAFFASSLPLRSLHYIYIHQLQLLLIG